MLACMMGFSIPKSPRFSAHFLYLQNASALQFLECTYRQDAKNLATGPDLDLT